MTLHTLDWNQLLLLQATIALAYLLRGLSGFGSALVAIPLLIHQFPLTVVLPLIALLDNLAAAQHGVQHRRSIAWRDLLSVLPLVLAGMTLGFFALGALDTDTLQLILGVLLTGYAAHALLKPPGACRRRLAVALPFGALGGFVGALLGTGGPFYVIYLRLRGHGALRFRATVAAVLLIEGTIRFGGYLLKGMLDTTFASAALAAVPIMLLSLLLGNRLHTGITPRHRQRIISVVVLASGLSLLIG